MRRRIRVARTTTGRTVNVTLVDGDHTSTVTIRVTTGIAQMEDAA